MYVVLLVLSLFIYVSSLSDCILDDFTKTISTCDETSHTRSIKYIYNKNCQIKNESLIFYTKNPTVSIPCNKTCPPGQFLLYNPTLKKSQCEDCPMNTYSMGNDLNIQYWSSEIIDMFDISCSKADNTKQNCKVTTTDDKKNLMISLDDKGSLIKNDEEYEINLVLNIDNVEDGIIKVLFNTSTILENHKIEKDNIGKASILIDKIEITSSTLSKGYSSVLTSIKKGKHQLIMKYRTKYLGEMNVFYIKTVMITNAFDISLSCNKCKENSPFTGASFCRSCNQYQIRVNNKCIDCVNGEINVDNKCVNVKQCDEFDYHLVSANEECDEKLQKRTIYYILDKNEDTKCIEKTEGSNFISTNKKKCTSMKQSSHSYCKQNNQFVMMKYTLKNDFYMNDYYFETIRNEKNNFPFLSSGKYLYVPRNTMKGHVYHLIKRIYIVSHQGYVKFHANVDIDTDIEDILLKIDNKVISIRNNDTYTIDLLQGEYYFDLLYEKKSKNEELKIPIIIDMFEIAGEKDTNLYKDEYICQDCPEGYQHSNDGFSCQVIKEPSKNDTIATQPEKNETTTKTQTGKNETTQTTKPTQNNDTTTQPKPSKDNSKPKIVITPVTFCPLFTKLIQSTITLPNNTDINISLCKLLSTFEYKQDMIKFDLDNYFDSLHYYTNNNLHRLFSTTSNTDLIGPISYSESSLFISIASPILFSFDPLTGSFGHIISVTSDNSTTTYKTLATQITKVSLIDFKTQTGVLISYGNGDKCINNKPYQVNLYLKCNKNIKGVTYPNITKQSEDGCNILIESYSSLFCRTCRDKELSYSFSKCMDNNKKYAVYEENNNCLIRQNTANKDMITEKNKDIVLDDKDEVYKSLIKGKERDFNWNKKWKKSKYIEKRIRQEECNVVDVVESKFDYLVIGVALLYGVSAILLIIYCIKYLTLKKKVKMINNGEAKQVTM